MSAQVAGAPSLLRRCKNLRHRSHRYRWRIHDVSAGGDGLVVIGAGVEAHVTAATVFDGAFIDISAGGWCAVVVGAGIESRITTAAVIGGAFVDVSASGGSTVVIGARVEVHVTQPPLSVAHSSMSARQHRRYWHRCRNLRHRSRHCGGAFVDVSAGPWSIRGATGVN